MRKKFCNSPSLRTSCNASNFRCETLILSRFRWPLREWKSVPLRRPNRRPPPPPAVPYSIDPKIRRFRWRSFFRLSGPRSLRFRSNFSHFRSPDDRSNVFYVFCKYWTKNFFCSKIKKIFVAFFCDEKNWMKNTELFTYPLENIDLLIGTFTNIKACIDRRHWKKKHEITSSPIRRQ